MQIEFKERTKVKCNVYGKMVELNKPTVGQIEIMQETMKNLKTAGSDKTEMGIMKKLVTDLGMPADVAGGLELDHFVQLIEGLCEVKKK